MSLTTSAEQQVFQSIKRVCYAGLDSVTLRTEVARRVSRVIATDADNFATMDPETGLLTHGIATNLSGSLLRDFLGSCYPDDEATKCLDQARAGVIVQRGADGDLAGLLRREGIGHDLRALFTTPEALWGSWCFLRGTGSSAFTDREIRFVERIAPHVAEGLKSAALLELATSREEIGDPLEEVADPGTAPGFLVLSARGEIVLRTPAAAVYLDDLGGEGAAVDGRLPFAVHSVRGRLLRQGAAADDLPADARLRARGRSGNWISLRATLSEPDAAGASCVVVSIEPVARGEVAPLLFRLYGLSSREREVVLWVMRGEPTKRIAVQLGLSAHTVQDYLDKACDKIGVRGRKALVAKLFRDGFAPSLVA